MSTYTDLHNKAKETLNVDYHTRITPQKAHFLNPENSFHGTFVGEGHFKGNNHIDGGKIENVLLKDSTVENIKFTNGLVIDDIKQTLDEISVELERQDGVDKQLDAVDKQLSSAVVFEKQERQIADINISAELTKTISLKETESISRDNLLNEKIDLEISNRISADARLEKKIVDHHLVLNVVDHREYPSHLKDYAVNTYVDSCPQAYVYKHGNTETMPIGKIEKAEFDENGNVISFELNAFVNNPDSYEITANGKLNYRFDENNKVQYTEVGSYRLTYDAQFGQKLEDIRIMLDSSNKYGYYDVLLDDSKTVVGMINANYKRDDNHHISKCNLFIKNELLSNFVRPVPFMFNNNGETIYFKGKSGKHCEATLSDDLFCLYEEHHPKHYLPALDDNTAYEFARIYSNGIKAEYGELREIDVYHNDLKQCFFLKAKNDFRMPMFNDKQNVFIEYDVMQNKIKTYEEQKYYKYSFVCNHGSLIPNKVNTFIDENYDQINIQLNFDASCIKDYVNGSYTLTHEFNSNKYSFEKAIEKDNVGKLKITFLKDSQKTFVELFNVFGDRMFEATLELTEDYPEHIGETIPLRISSKLCENIYDVKKDEMRLDDDYKQKYVLKPNLLDISHSGEDKVLECRASVEKTHIVDFLMPKKIISTSENPDDFAAKFILNFKVYSKETDEDNIVKVNLISRACGLKAKDKFFYGGKEVQQLKMLINEWTTLQFEEVRPHHYVITDLNYAEINCRINALKQELSEHEISSYQHIVKLSDDVEFLLSVDREEMSYKGTLPFLSAESWIDPTTGKTEYGQVKLSAFIAQSPHIHHGMLKLGDMFKLSAAQWHENKLYDKHNVANYLGEDDYFVVNSPLLKVEDVAWTNVDIFRNAETETKELSIQLTAQINATSSFLSDNIDQLSAKTTEICAAISTFIDISSSSLCSEISSLKLSVSELSATTENLCVELSNYIDGLELSVAGLSDSVDVSANAICLELSSTELSIDDLQNQIISNDADIEYLSSEISSITRRDLSSVRYFGTVELSDKYNFDEATGTQLTSNTLFGLIKKNAYINKSDKELKSGFLFRTTTKEIDKIFEISANGFVSEIRNNEYLIVNKDIAALSDIALTDVDIMHDYDISCRRLQNQLISNDNDIEFLSGYVDGLELSVAGLSGTTDALCTGLSNHVDDLELSVAGLSGTTDALCASLSNCIDDLELSVAGLSNHVDDLELSVAGLSGTTDALCASLSNCIDDLELSVAGLSGTTDALCAGLSNHVDDLELSVAGLSGTTTDLCAGLSNHVDDLELSVSRLSGYVDGLELSTNIISTALNNICTDISTEVSANDQDIFDISSDLDDLNTHYHKSFIEVEYKEQSSGPDLCVDVLNVVDGDNTNNKYILQFLSGTLVLVPVEQ